VRVIGGPNIDSCNGGVGTDTATTCEAVLGVPERVLVAHLGAERLIG
jgi:hypothetical protein